MRYGEKKKILEIFCRICGFSAIHTYVRGAPHISHKVAEVAEVAVHHKHSADATMMIITNQSMRYVCMREKERRREKKRFLRFLSNLWFALVIHT